MIMTLFFGTPPLVAAFFAWLDARSKERWRFTLLIHWFFLTVILFIGLRGAHQVDGSDDGLKIGTLLVLTVLHIVVAFVLRWAMNEK